MVMTLQRDAAKQGFAGLMEVLMMKDAVSTEANSCPSSPPFLRIPVPWTLSHLPW